MDQDYIKDLSEEEKTFLSQFNEEYYGAGLDYKDLSNNLHNTEKLKKDCTDRNNARNRCAYGIARAGDRINDVSILKLDDKEATNFDIVQKEEIHSDPNLEDALIDYLDSKKSQQ